MQSGIYQERFERGSFVDVSIVIVSYNIEGMLRDCLKSIPEGVAGLEAEIFVVDNNSPDGSVTMVRTEFPGVTVIANQSNAGFTRANNQALTLCAGRYKLILNPDTEAKPGSIRSLVEFLDSHPEAGAVGPQLLNTDGSLQKSGCRFPSPTHEFLAISGLRNLNRAAFDTYSWQRDNFDLLAEVDCVSGACLMVRGDVMAQVGMLSEDFFMFYEEVEWCWRIRKAGFKVFYLPESKVTHHWMGSVRQNSKAMTDRLMQSQVIYYRKTASFPTQLAARLVSAFGRFQNRFIHFGVAVKRRLFRSKRPAD